jgi:putative ABC transport system permease protein
VPLIARLRAGATLSQARNEIPSLVRQVRQAFPFPMARNWNADSTAISLQQDLTGDVRGKLVILLASVGILLLIACSNVANLLLARATARRKEMGLRIALGAARFRLIRQLLTEGLLLSFLGSAGGLLLGTAGLSIFKSLLPSDTPGLASAVIDWQVAAFVAALALFTGIAFGLAPALSASHLELAASIKTGSTRSAAGRLSSLRSWLIAAEVALTLLLLVGTGLLLKSLYRLSGGNPGFDAQGILRIHISPSPSLCSQPAACLSLYEKLLQDARAVRGVSEAALTNAVPLDGDLPTLPVDVEGHPKSIDFPAPVLFAGAISPGYLHALQIPLLSGRAFTSADGPQAAHVLLINRAAARRFWPGQNPLGKHLKWTGEQQWRTVVGVVGDLRQHSLAADLPAWIAGAVYMPYAQSLNGDGRVPAAMNLLVKGQSGSALLRRELHRLAAQEAPNAPVGEVEALTDIVSRSIGAFRSTIQVFLAFAAAALLLAAVGIYGLVSYWVTQRTYEIGVRVAIGASRSQIVSLVLRDGIRLSLFGMAAGLLGAFALTRFLNSFLYGVTSTDPLTFAAVLALLFAVVATAAGIPSWRAALTDPLRALRVD